MGKFLGAFLDARITQVPFSKSAQKGASFNTLRGHSREKNFQFL
jgi:hypothetical protein